MTETIKSIRDRNSCRDFADTPLTDEQIKLLVESALAAPSGLNMQPWHVTVITNKDFIEELDKEGVAVLAADEDKSYYNRVMGRGGKMFYNAPCMIAVSADGSKWSQIDSGILCQNIALTAQSIGLGSCIVGLLRMPLISARGDEFKKRMKFPEGYELALGVLVGNVKTGKEPHELEFNRVSYV